MKTDMDSLTGRGLRDGQTELWRNGDRHGQPYRTGASGTDRQSSGDMETVMDSLTGRGLRDGQTELWRHGDSHGQPYRTGASRTDRQSSGDMETDMDSLTGWGPPGRTDGALETWRQTWTALQDGGLRDGQTELPRHGDRHGQPYRTGGLRDAQTELWRNGDRHGQPYRTGASGTDRQSSGDMETVMDSLTGWGLRDGQTELWRQTWTALQDGGLRDRQTELWRPWQVFLVALASSLGPATTAGALTLPPPQKKIHGAVEAVSGALQG